MTPNPSDFQEWLESRQAQLEASLEEALPAAHIAPQRLHEAMRYAVLGGGKRVRPLLACAAAETVGAEPGHALRAAAAVELIHAYSLVHDDLPCMDNDVLRRGKPTCHIAFDEATALLVGDSLQTLAFQLLAEPDDNLSPATQLEMLKLLATASGSRGMAGGQAIDLASTGKTLSVTELEFMHIHKTGALIRAAVLLGARCGTPLRDEEYLKLDRFAKCIGLAFQVVDDLLDTVATTDVLGKTAGKDARDNKPTYVSVLGLSATRALSDELRQRALACLAPFGERARRLRELTEFIVSRPC